MSLTVLEPTAGLAWRRIVDKLNLQRREWFRPVFCASDPLFPRWLCPPQFELGVGDEWEGPFADIYETTAEQDHFILEASQQLDAEGAPGPAPANRRLDDAEVDELLLMASQALESATEKVPPDDPRPGTDKDRFSSPVSSTEVQEVRKRGVPKKTAAQTGWAAKVWVDWAKQRLTKPFVDEEEEKCVLCEDFTSMQVNSMKCWLPKFVLEIRRRDGAYTIHLIHSMVYARG